MTIPLVARLFTEWILCTWKLITHKVDSKVLHTSVTWLLLAESHVLWNGKTSVKKLSKHASLCSAWLVKNFFMNFASIDFLFVYDKILKVRYNARKEKTKNMRRAIILETIFQMQIHVWCATLPTIKKHKAKTEKKKEFISFKNMVRFQNRNTKKWASTNKDQLTAQVLTRKEAFLYNCGIN